MLKSMAMDAAAHFPVGHPMRQRRWRAIFIALMTSSGMRATALYRLAHWSRPRFRPIGLAVSKLLFWFIRHWYTCSLSSTAEIGGGLILPHPQGIVIGTGAIVGERTWIYQNVTIGGSPVAAGMPRIGSDARIGAGAVILGPVTIGCHVAISANVVVRRDVADNGYVVAPEPEVRTRKSSQ